MCLTMDLKRPQISSFREQNSVPPETWIPEFHARAHMVCPSSCLGSLGQIELQGGDLTFGTNHESQCAHPDLKPPSVDLLIAHFLY